MEQDILFSEMKCTRLTEKKWISYMHFITILHVKQQLLTWIIALSVEYGYGIYYVIKGIGNQNIW